MLFSLAVVVLAPSVAAFYIMWPAQVLQGTNRSVQWHDGVPPYELDVDSVLPPLYPTKRLYTYVGDDWAVYWVIDVLPGTVIRYSVTDSAGEQSNSSELTVQPNPILTTASLMSISSLASVSSVSVISTSSTGTPSKYYIRLKLDISTHSNPSSTLSKTSNSPSPTQKSSGGSSNTRVIVVGAVGGAVAVLLIGLGAFFLLKRRKGYSRGRDDAFEEPYTIYPIGYAQVATQNVPSPSKNTPLDAIPPRFPSDIVGSMMTAPTNEDEEYYKRVVKGGRSGYIGLGDAREYSSTPPGSG
ncbi:uncharacterized protein EI90DRAFT_3076415 [Cantharellus anzutake]|uniref:uncharacterized protein n=1 Tax=Cantharellus anzutake TaxID=1750568 RepID=UPI0019061289|nr:uncharacterized protein EI90DRAFT_3076415 [Cantharellus anzutake]KAF8324227.1 hypothetical protein EI90DRAFT_3076415 [Cantharellus anzutake]